MPRRGWRPSSIPARLIPVTPGLAYRWSLLIGLMLRWRCSPMPRRTSGTRSPAAAVRLPRARPRARLLVLRPSVLAVPRSALPPLSALLAIRLSLRRRCGLVPALRRAAPPVPTGSVRRCAEQACRAPERGAPLPRGLAATRAYLRACGVAAQAAFLSSSARPLAVVPSVYASLFSSLRSRRVAFAFGDLPARCGACTPRSPPLRTGLRPPMPGPS